MEIIPAVLPKSLSELQEKIALLPREAKTVHLDFCDNGFLCPEIFPFRDRFLFEAHLMLAEPERVFDAVIRAGVSRIIVHIETVRDFGKLKALRGWSQPPSIPPLEGGKERGVEIGLAINLDTPSEVPVPFLSEIDVVQFMGIKNVGFQGQPFDNRVIEKVAKFHAEHPDIVVSVDGGVNAENAPALGSAGASRLVVGSAIAQFTFFP